MHSVQRVVTRVVTAGRIGRKRSFVVALGVAMLLLPVTTALAFFSATGSGTFANVQAVATSPSTVAIAQQNSTTYTYKDSAGAAATALPLGGSVTIPISVTCTAGAPCTTSTIALQSWTSDKAGCDATTLPGSFTGNNPAVLTNLTLTAVGTQATGNYVITWVNLSSTNQNACLGAKFSFVLAAA